MIEPIAASLSNQLSNDIIILFALCKIHLNKKEPRPKP